MSIQKGNAAASKAAIRKTNPLGRLRRFATAETGAAESKANKAKTARPDIALVFGDLPTLTYGDAVNAETPAPEPFFDNGFEKGDKAELLGESKSRKSWFTLALLLHLAAGRDFCGLGIKRAWTVVYVNLELTDKWLARRLKAMMKAYGITPEMVGDRFVVVNARGKADKVREMLAQFSANTGIDLVAVDPRYKLNLAGQDDNSAADLAELLAIFDWVASMGPAVLSVVHDGKGAAGDRDIRDRGAGSSVSGRDCDARIALSRHRLDPKNMLVVEMLSRNFAQTDPFSVVFDSSTRTFRRTEDAPLAVTSASAKKSSTDNDSEISKAVLSVVSAKGSPTTSEIVSAVGSSTGFHERRIRETLGRLVERGRLVATRTGNSTFAAKRYVCTAASSNVPDEEKEVE